MPARAVISTNFGGVSGRVGAATGVTGDAGSVCDREQPAKRISPRRPRIPATAGRGGQLKLRQQRPKVPSGDSPLGSVPSRKSRGRVRVRSALEGGCPPL